MPEYSTTPGSSTPKARTGLLATALTTGALAAGLVLAPAASGSSAESSGTANPATEDLTDEQIDNARTIIGTGKADDVSDDAITVALMTALQESSLLNQEGGDRDSVGLFQQRPSMGWGSADDIGDPVFAAQSFYGTNADVPNPGLLQIEGWDDLERGGAAQAVQRSAFPDAYDKWEPLAEDLLEENDDVDPID